MTCKLCPLWESALVSNCMPGHGPEHAEIMIVGQGPGGYEDMAGVPFVGKSGIYLNGMLADAGIDRDACFVTNATRCRPPLVNKKERAPTPDEVNTCRRYLIEEVHRVRPKAIIALGDVALRALCKTSGIKAKRGQVLELHPEFEYECPVFPTYHPAFLLRKNQPLRSTVVSDLRRARDRNLPTEHIDWIPAERPGFYGGKVAYDIECIDDAGAIVEQPTQVAFATGADHQVIVCQWPAEVTFAAPTNLISHFGWDFDDHKTGWRSTRDTAALAYLDDETQPLGLESLAVKYLGVRGWKEERNGAVLGSPALSIYNARDSLCTLRLHDALVDRLGDRIKIADEILLPARLALDDCSQRGLRIDLSAVLTARARFADEIMEARVRCKTLAHDSDLNPGSYPQVALVLRGRGFELPRTDHGNDATGKAILSGFHDDFADAVIDYREAVKADSTYGKPYEQAARREDQRMRCRYTVIRTVTGRTSAQRHPDFDPSTNVQNLPRTLHHFLKDVVIADYSGIEFRLAAWLAQEPTIIEEFKKDPKWDPHAYIAGWCGVDRQAGKTTNFSQIYLGSAQTLIEYGKRTGVAIGDQQAQGLHHGFRRLYKGFIPWWLSIRNFVEERGYIESPTGRRRHFGEWDLLSGRERMDVWREAVNMPVQSLGADLGLIALACCKRANLPINGFFHDAISFDRSGGWQPDVELIRRCMVDEPLEILRTRFAVHITIPIEIDIKYR